MKKLGRQKIIAILTLTTLLTFLSAPVTRAQEVKLLPNATGDYEVQTIPPQEQNYRIRQAGVEDLFGDLACGVADTLPFWTPLRLACDFVNGKIDSQTWVFNIILHIMNSVNLILTGPTAQGWSGGEEGGSGGGGSSGFGSFDYRNSGALGATAYLMGSLFQDQPNLGTTAFIKQELSENILSDKALAAPDEVGTKFFSPVHPLWTLMRNISYVFFVAILILMGLMIMLRYQVDPRTTMTVTAALPRIAVSLILITFSYPLAGIILDLARVLRGLIDTTLNPVFSAAGMTLTPIEPIRMIVEVWGRMGLVNTYFGGTGIFSLFVTIIIQLIMLFVAFALLFTLIIRFANLFIQVIFAPFAFLWGALPGQEDTITSWFKAFLVNTLTFPAVYFLFNFALLVLTISAAEPFSLPPGLGAAPTFPATIFQLQRNVGGLVAFGIILAATKVPEVLEEAFAVTPPAHVARAGVEPMKMAQRLPVVGGLLK